MRDCKKSCKITNSNSLLRKKDNNKQDKIKNPKKIISKSYYRINVLQEEGSILPYDSQYYRLNYSYYLNSRLEYFTKNIIL
jgi:hypothetical protein